MKKLRAPPRAIDQNTIREIFEAINAAAAGYPLPHVLCAFVDQVTAALCYSAASKEEAMKFAGLFHRDVISTIELNYDHYHSAAGSIPGHAAGNG